MGPCNHARAVRKQRKPDIAGIGSPPAACASAARRLREGKAMPIDEYLWLPCWSCTKPQASDVRVWLANSSHDDRANQRSPSGLPLSCCCVRTVGMSLTDAMHAPAT